MMFALVSRVKTPATILLAIFVQRCIGQRLKLPLIMRMMNLLGKIV
ncbi:hypothetical protein Pint_09916 [Pistacia integerrima]|uniref:Uncharacterized protein n=1 Tax=Pistacia integerrima TaxID=434235 RepID=A0ACC0XK50_9ROSI|nr:hypothetical protein Pint_09916 [Pistacia integerrima]